MLKPNKLVTVGLSQSLNSLGLHQSEPVFATVGSAGGASKRAALKMLQQDPLQSVSSVIMYCTFQSQTDEIAQYLYSQGISALSYHAGKSFKVDPFCFALVARTALLQPLRLIELLPANCTDRSQTVWVCKPVSVLHHTIGKAAPPLDSGVLHCCVPHAKLV